MDNNELKAEKLAEIFFDRFFSNWKKLSPTEFLNFLKPKIDQVITFDELENRIKSGKKLKIKFGIDPTGPDVHLGHLLPIMFLRQFQKAGHEIHLIIGDFTAMIGDPSGRNAQRPPLSEKEIENNLKTYLSQIGKYLDVKNVKNHKNSKWLSKVSLKNAIKDLSKVNLSEVLQRDDFRKRIASGHSLSVAELLYAYAQGIDSVELNPDIEVGGRDQLLNFAQGRRIMEMYGQNPEVALTAPVLEGIGGDGRKMSKSYGNYIAVNSTLEDKFGKTMSIPDNLILPYFTAFADVKESELKELKKIISENPLETKKQLAQFLVSIEVKKLEAGNKERKSFENKFSEKIYDDIPVIEAKKDWTFFDVVVASGVFPSKSEVRRLFESKSVHLTGSSEKTLKYDDKAQSGTIKVGKKNFFKVIVK